MLRDGTFYEPQPSASVTDLRICEENDSIGLDIEAEHWMAIVALRVHQHRLARPPPDLPKEAAEQVRVEIGTHVIPQQISHPAMLPGSPTNAPPFPLTKDRGPAPELILVSPRSTGRGGVG